MNFQKFILFFFIYIIRPMINTIDIESASSSTYQSIRIYFDFFYLDGQNNISDTIKNGIKHVLFKAREVLEILISVKRHKGPLFVEDPKNPVPLSSSLKQNGVLADVIVLPFVDTTLPAKNIEAFEKTIQYLPSNHRPVVGIIGFSSDFCTTNENWVEYYTALALHELTHLLVMDPIAFSYFIDEDGNPLHEVSKNIVIQGKEKALIVTPKVVKLARKHFNCPTLEGVELDNKTFNTTGAHWEERIMLGDYMTISHYSESVISEITLALFEDSGWYKCNYYTGGLFKFGKNQGCGFLSNPGTAHNNATEFSNRVAICSSLIDCALKRISAYDETYHCIFAKEIIIVIPYVLHFVVMPMCLLHFWIFLIIWVKY